MDHGSLGKVLQEFWDSNRKVNDSIKSARPEVKNWSEVYVLGLIEEAGEFLKASQWKKHRLPAAANLSNVRHEIVDIITYAVCLSQEYEIPLNDVVEGLLQKSQTVYSRFAGEFFPPSSSRVIVTDLDGTVADFREGFANWCGFKDQLKTLSVDLDNTIPFAEYESMKFRFENQGGYYSLPEYKDAVALLQREQRSGTAIVVTTARPFGEHHRIERDSRRWLADRGIIPVNVVFGRDNRILMLLNLAESHSVVLLEDDAVLAQRAAESGIHVMLRDQPYNEKVSHPNVKRYTTFPSSILWSWLEEK